MNRAAHAEREAAGTAVDPCASPRVSPPALLTARAVVRRFGRRTVLHDVDLTLSPGRVVALIGPNGAGKSTLLSVLAGHLRPSSGEVAWHAPDRHGRFRGWLGMSPQGAALPRYETPRRFLAHLARLQRAEKPQESAAEILDAVGLGARGEVRMRALSEGERKLVAIGQAFLGAPRVVLLDEPTSALDPWGRQRLRALVRARRDAGGAVLLASHNLAEAEQLCDEALILVGGRIEAAGPLSTLLHAPAEVRFEIGAGGSVPADDIRAALAETKVDFDPDTRILTLQAIEAASPIEHAAAVALRLLSEAGAEVRRVVYGRSLERALTSLVTGQGRTSAAAGAEIVRA